MSYRDVADQEIPNVTKNRALVGEALDGRRDVGNIKGVAWMKPE